MPLLSGLVRTCFRPAVVHLPGREALRQTSGCDPGKSPKGGTDPPERHSSETVDQRRCMRGEPPSLVTPFRARVFRPGGLAGAQAPDSTSRSPCRDLT